MPRPRNFDPSEVLEGAVDMFREHGYEGTSMPQLIDRLGICRQSFYKAFGDKRGLYLRALERWGEREVDAKLTLLAADGPPLDNVRTLIRGFAAMATTCPSEGCLTVTAMVESREDPEVLALVDRQVARLEAGITAALTQARARGELKSGARPARLARALTTAVYGMGVLTRLPGSGPRIGDTVDVLLDLLDEASED
jgi:TetR/AcrR family transcriptional repressor of nem operon